MAHQRTLYILVNSKHVLDRTKKVCLLIGVLSWELLGTADTSQEITIEINFCLRLTTQQPGRKTILEIIFFTTESYIFNKF